MRSNRFRRCPGLDIRVRLVLRLLRPKLLILRRIGKQFSDALLCSVSVVMMTGRIKSWEGADDMDR